MNAFWDGFEKQAMAMPRPGITRGMFSRGGTAQAVAHNPLPTSGMKPMSVKTPMATGHGTPGMGVP